MFTVQNLKKLLQYLCTFKQYLITNSAIERILKAAPHMVNIQKNDGLSAIHLAVINNHAEIVLTLIKQVRAHLIFVQTSAPSPALGSV